MTTVTIGENTGDTYSGSIDAEIRQGTPTTNAGGGTLVETSKYTTGTDYRHTIMAFPGLSNITGPVTVSSASLFVYVNSSDIGATQTISVKRLLRNWVEAEATWNIYSTGNNWTTAGATADDNDRVSVADTTLAVANGASGYQQFTGLAALVQGWINGTYSNYGVHLERTDSSGDSRFLQWRSSEHATATTRPYLSVTYTAAGGSGNPMPWQQQGAMGVMVAM